MICRITPQRVSWSFSLAPTSLASTPSRRALQMAGKFQTRNKPHPGDNLLRLRTAVRICEHTHESARKYWNARKEKARKDVLEQIENWRRLCCGIMDMWGAIVARRTECSVDSGTAGTLPTALSQEHNRQARQYWKMAYCTRMEAGRTSKPQCSSCSCTSHVA